MGCVYSHAEDHKNRRPPPRSTKKRPLPAAVVVATKTTNNGRLPGAADLRKPSAITEPNHNVVTPSQNANLGAAASSEDMQFRRQHSFREQRM